MTTDPYVERIFDLLGTNDPITVLETTPEQLEHYLNLFSPHDLGLSYASGKWTVSELFCHYADVELGLGFRFRQAVATVNYTPQSFDQDIWAARYGRLEPSLALETFRALRAWNLALFSTFDMEDWNCTVNYPFAGIDTVDDMVRFLAGHDLNHLKQLESVAQSA